MKSHIVVLLFFAALIVCIFVPLGSAAPGAAELFPVTITDDLGNEVFIPAEPERIVSLSPSNTEILYALGLGDRIVAVTDHSDYPEEACEKPSVGGFSSPSIEKILEAEPDLVVASHGNAAELKDKLKDEGLTVIVLNPTTIDDVMNDIVLIGNATGTAQKADDIVSDMSRRLHAIMIKTAPFSYAPTVAQFIYIDPIYVSGNNTFQNEVIHSAGGINIFEEQVDGWGILGLETIVAAQPDYIIASSGSGMGTTGSDVIFDFFSTNPVFRDIPAVKNDRIFVVNADIISRGGPRIIDAVEEVSGILHPTLFPESTPVQTGNASGSQSTGLGTFLVPLSMLVIACCIRLNKK